MFIPDILLIVLLFLSVFFYRSILLKIILFISFYPTIVLLLCKYNYPMKGILEMQITYFTAWEKNFAFYGACIAYIVFWMTLLPLRKKTYSYPRFILKKETRLWLAFAYLVLFILTYPRAFGIDIGINSGSLCLCVSVLIIASKEKRFDLPSVVHMAFLVFALIFGERVDAILALVFHFIVAGEYEIREAYNAKKTLPIFFIVFVIGLFTETQRMGGELDTNYVESSVLTQSTAVDVSYVYLTGVDYYKNSGTTPVPLMNTLFGYLPGKYGGVNSEYNYTIFLNNNVLPNAGGGLYYTDGLLILGKWGLLLYPFLLGMLTRFLFNKKKMKFVLPFLLLFIMQLRMQWYGLIYYYTPVILLFFAGCVIDYVYENNYQLKPEAYGYFPGLESE